MVKKSEDKRTNRQTTMEINGLKMDNGPKREIGKTAQNGKKIQTPRI